MNKVMLLGNIGRDPEVKFTTKGIAFTNLSIATEKRVKGENGDWSKGVEWHSVDVYGKQAETCGQYLKKGRTVFIEGRLQTEKYEDKKSGESRTKLKIIADEVRFVGGNKTSDEETKETVSDQASGDIPF